MKNYGIKCMCKALDFYHHGFINHYATILVSKLNCWVFTPGIPVNSNLSNLRII